MNASIKLSYTEDGKEIAIPSSAIIFDKSKNYVLVFKNRNNIQTREIKVVRRVGETTFVSQGLAEGEKVVTKNQLFIYSALND